MPTTPIDLSGFNAGWTFAGRAGLSTIGSAWSAVSPLPSGAVYAFLQGADSSALQSFTTSDPRPHSIAFYVQSNWWPTGAQRLDVLIDGEVAFSTGALNPYAWAGRSFPWTPTAAGPHTIEFRSTNPDPNETAYLDSVTITDPSSVPIALANGNFDAYTVLAPGQLVYRPPAVATATFRATWAVTTSGKLLEFGLTRIDDGSAVVPGTINAAPTIAVNGVARGLVDFAGALATSAHPTRLVRLPAGLVLAAGDVVTLTAPEGWIFGPAGYAEGMTGQPATNCVGRSFVRLADVPRTMWVGASYAEGVTAEWHTGFLPRNQRYRNAFWNPPHALTDGNQKPLVLGGASASAPVVSVTASSLIDSTGVPTPTGLWGVAWDDLDGVTGAALHNNGDADTSCTLVGSVDLPLSGGGTRRFRAYDFEPTGSVVNLHVFVRLTSGQPDHSVALGEFAILAPGDFTWTPGQTTIPPTPLWSDVAGAVDAQLPPSLPFGPHRLPTHGGGGSSACEREHVVEPDDFHWAQGVKDVRNVIYTQARPWTVAASPYIYDPMAGTDYPASLVAPIMTAPPPGTVETITLAQVGDGLILAGLVLTIDSERLRVMNPPTGPPTALAVSVMRGAESTTPTPHPISPPAVETIAVSARRPMADLAAFGYQNQQITELVTQSPHRMKTGQILPMGGNSWPNFVYSDGRGFVTDTPTDGNYHGFGPYVMPVYVTGASTFVVIEPGPFKPTTYPNTTLGSTYTLTPGDIAHGTGCYSQLYLPEYGGVPYEVAATASARRPGVPAWVSFCMVASDDMIDSIWRRILAYLPADRDVWFELSDEPWNSSGSPPFLYWALMSAQLYGAYNPYYWYGVRVAQIRARGKAIWAAAGRDPARVKSSINVQDINGTSVGGLLDWLAAHGAAPDSVAIAPYYNLYPDPAMWAAWAAWDTDELVDAWIWDYYRNTSPGDQNWSGASLHRVGDFKRGIDAWNAAQSPAGGVTLQVYEYGIDNPWPVYTANLGGVAMDATTTTLTLPNANAYNPHADAWDDCQKICPGTWLYLSPEWVKVVSRSGATCTVLRGQGGSPAVPHSPGDYFRGEWMEGTRDVTLHPNFRIAHRDVLERIQALGVSLLIPSAQCMEWYAGNAWADYHASAQRPGKGDGSDGDFDNRLCEARRGRPNSKPATVNQDANTVSVRGQGMIDFLSGAAAVSPTPTPTPTPPTPTTAGRRWLESGAGRLLEGGGYRRLEGAKAVASGRLRPSYAMSVVRSD